MIVGPRFPLHGQELDTCMTELHQRANAHGGQRAAYMNIHNSRGYSTPSLRAMKLVLYALEQLGDYPSVCHSFLHLYHCAPNA
jgi:hypothetical protein